MLNPSESFESSLTIREGPESQDGHQFQKKNLYQLVRIFNAALLS